MALLAILLLLVGVVAFILCTESGARITVELGLRWYRAQIAGDVGIARVRGRVFRDLQLEGVRALEDGEISGRSIVVYKRPE